MPRDHSTTEPHARVVFCAVSQNAFSEPRDHIFVPKVVRFGDDKNDIEIDRVDIAVKDGKLLVRVWDIAGNGIWNTTQALGSNDPTIGKVQYEASLALSQLQALTPQYPGKFQDQTPLSQAGLKRSLWPC